VASTNTATKRPNPRRNVDVTTSPLQAERQETAHREDHGDVGAALLETKNTKRKTRRITKFSSNFTPNLFKSQIFSLAVEIIALSVL